MRALIIESDDAAAASMFMALRSEGYDATVVTSVTAAVAVLAVGDYEIILLEPRGTGAPDFDSVKSLRGVKPETALIIVATYDRTEYKVRELDAGADDYMVKPVAKDELLARIRAILRRSHGTNRRTVVQVGNVMIDIANGIVKVKGRRIYLTIKETQILIYLAQNKGRTRTREEICDNVYKDDEKPEDLKTIDVNIARLRSKLGTREKVIETLKGRGYMLREPERRGRKK